MADEENAAEIQRRKMKTKESEIDNVVYAISTHRGYVDMADDVCRRSNALRYTKNEHGAAWYRNAKCAEKAWRILKKRAENRGESCPRASIVKISISYLYRIEKVKGV